MKFALIKELRSSGDARVLFSPLQLAQVMKQYPEHSFIVESSKSRAFSDEEYKNRGIKVEYNVSHADVFLGIKEVPLAHLISGKTYFFFSHTTKMQPHNKQYLQGLKDKNITFYDYENFTNNQGNRLVYFGKNAGYIGGYHAIRTYGIKNNLFLLPKPHTLNSITELLLALSKINLPPIKIVTTGTGNVGKGIVALFNQIKVRRVSPIDFLNKKYEQPVYTQLSKRDYLVPKDNSLYNESDFKKFPYSYKSDFEKYTNKAEVMIAGHFYQKGMPLFFTSKQIQKKTFKINTIADISCDLFMPLPTCLRTSTIQKPIYGYHKTKGIEVDFFDSESIAIMAVDNLPCEFPKESSFNFGKQFETLILPLFLNDKNNPIIEKACVLNQGEFTKAYKYLEKFLEHKAS